MHAYWDVRVQGRCISAEDHFASTSIIGIVLDFAIWMVPIPVVVGLRMRWKEKVGLLILFGMGGL